MVMLVKFFEVPKGLSHLTDMYKLSFGGTCLAVEAW